MTYIDFANKFLVELARSYRSGQMDLHCMIDFSLWKQVFPDDEKMASDFSWRRINFNAFTLDDDEKSLLIVYNIPLINQKKEAEFIGIRFNNNRKQILYYSLRRPKYHDDPWDIYLFDFEKNEDIYISKIYGTDSLREFKAAIERMPFRDKPSTFERIRNKIIS